MTSSRNSPGGKEYERDHDHCQDRGDSFRQKSGEYASEGVVQRESSETLFDILWYGRITPANNNSNHRFIPFHKLEMVRNRVLTQNSLTRDGVDQKYIPELLRKICTYPTPEGESSYFRIFAILVLCGRPKYISNFIEQHIDDSYLPLPMIERNKDTFTAIPRRHGRSISRDKLESLFWNETDWRPADLNAIDTFQWWTMAPFFYRPDNAIPHYILEDSDILPFTEKKGHTELELESLDQDVREVVLQGALQGGFSDVFIVKLHASHNGFGNHPYSDGSGSYALKRLKSPNMHDFELEVNALRKYKYDIDDHLIPLLATIEKEDEAGKYYLLFPKANGNLRDLWAKGFNGIDPSEELVVRWMAEECIGIAKALSMLHKDQDADRGEDFPIYGRHGDIKAGNILWFSKPDIKGPLGWRLVLSDFGLMRFHRAISISAQTANKLKKTLTYQAPEFDIAGAKISRKSDIWALGCTYLEFATWYISGYEAVEEEFPSRRAQTDDDLFGISEDKFYRVLDDGKSAELKPRVREWISDLRGRPKCSPYLCGFLDFIEDKMLRIERDERSSASQVVSHLESLLGRLPNQE
ncbi:kinase-like protein [Hypomontagnella monticulosa]|nr:kinase-like protein [Hypomontagnella monticulosa]